MEVFTMKRKGLKYWGTCASVLLILFPISGSVAQSSEVNADSDSPRVWENNFWGNVGSSRNDSKNLGHINFSDSNISWDNSCKGNGSIFTGNMNLAISLSNRSMKTVHPFNSALGADIVSFFSVVSNGEKRKIDPKDIEVTVQDPDGQEIKINGDTEFSIEKLGNYGITYCYRSMDGKNVSSINTTFTVNDFNSSAINYVYDFPHKNVETVPADGSFIDPVEGLNFDYTYTDSSNNVTAVQVKREDIFVSITKDGQPVPLVNNFWKDDRYVSKFKAEAGTYTALIKVRNRVDGFQNLEHVRTFEVVKNDSNEAVDETVGGIVDEPVNGTEGNAADKTGNITTDETVSKDESANKEIEEIAKRVKQQMKELQDMFDRLKNSWWK